MLLVVDLQRAIDDPVGARLGPGTTRTAEQNVSALLESWRESSRPVVHVRHDSTFPDSTYRPGQRGMSSSQRPRRWPGETVVAKQVNSAVHGHGPGGPVALDGLRRLVVAGVITNNSVEATVRHAGNLGFDAFLVEDACFTFARPDYRGVLRTAEEVHAMSLANLEGEYCTVVTSADVLSAT